MYALHNFRHGGSNDVNEGESIIEALVLRGRLHFAFSTHKMDKLVPVCWFKEQADPSLKISSIFTVNDV